MIACGTVVRTEGAEHLFTGGASLTGSAGTSIYLSTPTETSASARGQEQSAKQLVLYMAHRSQRAAGVLEARVGSPRRSPFSTSRLDMLCASHDRRPTSSLPTTSHRRSDTLRALDDLREIGASTSS